MRSLSVSDSTAHLDAQTVNSSWQVWSGRRRPWRSEGPVMRSVRSRIKIQGGTNKQHSVCIRTPIQPFNDGLAWCARFQLLGSFCKDTSKEGEGLPWTHLEVMLQAEAMVPLSCLLVDGRHHASLLVVSDPLLEEVGLSLEGDHVHPLEGIGNFVLSQRVRPGLDE
eukprot:119069-Hanusia_phi.AAC.8